MEDFASAVKEKRQQQQSVDTAINEHKDLLRGSDQLQKVIIESTKANIRHRDIHEPNVTVKNFDPVVKSMQAVATSIDKKVFDPKQLQSTLKDFTSSIQTFSKSIPNFPEIPEPKEEITVTNLSDLKPYFDALQEGLKQLVTETPDIHVDGPTVNVPEVNLEPVAKAVSSIESAIKKIPKPEKIDLTSLTDAVNETTSTIANLRFPVPNYILPFKDTTGKDAQVTLDSGGNLPVVISSGGGGAVTVADGADVAQGATADSAVTAGSAGTISGKLRTISADISSIKSNQTNGTQHTIVDSSALPSGAATGSLQTTGNTSLSAIATNTGNGATSANQTTELTRIGDVTETAPATDTASSGLNGRLQRIAQRLTSIIALLPTSLGGGGGLKVDGSGTPLPVSGTVTITPSGTQDENIKQVNGVTVNVGIGAAGTGTQRVAVSSDSFPATQPVSGTVTETNSAAIKADLDEIAIDTDNLALIKAKTDNLDVALSTVAKASTQTDGTQVAGSILTGPNVGQTTSNTSAVQLQAGSIAAKNGMLVQAISTNVASVYIGGSGVTTSTGFELQAGQAVPFTASNVNVLYVIGANATDKVCWNIL